MTNPTFDIVAGHMCLDFTNFMRNYVFQFVSGDLIQCRFMIRGKRIKRQCFGKGVIGFIP